MSQGMTPTMEIRGLTGPFRGLIVDVVAKSHGSTPSSTVLLDEPRPKDETSRKMRPGRVFSGGKVISGGAVILFSCSGCGSTNIEKMQGCRPKRDEMKRCIWGQVYKQ